MFIVLKLTAAPDHLLGYLSRFLIEVAPGLLAGVSNAKVKDALWEAITSAIESGQAVMISSTPTLETGFEVQMHQVEMRQAIDYDGLQLISQPAARRGNQPENESDM